MRLPSRPPCHGCSPHGLAPPGSLCPARAVGPQIPPQWGVRLGSLKSGRRAALLTFSLMHHVLSPPQSEMSEGRQGRSSSAGEEEESLAILRR